MEKNTKQKTNKLSSASAIAIKEDLKKNETLSVKEPPQQLKTPEVSETVQEKIEDAKFFVGPSSYPLAPSGKELPEKYDRNYITLMVVDPYWIYSYWEVTPDRVEEGLRFLGCKKNEAKTVLRVCDVTGLEGGEGANQFFDIEVQFFIGNWYIHVNAPTKSFRVDIGLLDAIGRFFSLARSNTVTLPRVGVSEVVDEHWMSRESEKMYALSGGFKVGTSSHELKELMEKNFKENLSSGAVSSFGGSPVNPIKKKERSFWFVLNTELIVYGATEPDAEVTVGGRSIPLRPDGTFSLRFALPDGHFPIPATARSSDGVEERTITPVVQRNTEISKPVLKT
ncbi:MAG: DUF4912 domain-containing protein [Chlamydiae bacterium]|nr:DUF4912 domain-containing protein [Chlamydiota bacterium]MBI3276378.1 DUF4912 domain-containing protein [Chlamydiota bacterium]